MLNNIEKLAKWGFIALVISLCMIPFLALSRFVQPQYDDYSVWMMLQKYNLFEAQVIWYTSWTGRYAALFLISLFHPIIYGKNELIGLIGIFIQLAIPLSLFYSLRRVLPITTSLSNLLAVFSCILLIYYWQLPSPAEAFYWIPATFSYQLGLILMILFFGILWNSRGEHTKNEKRLLIFLAVLIPGTCEIALFLFLAGLGTTILFRLIEERKFNRFLNILGLIALSLSIFSVFAPGNSARAGVLQQIEGAQPGNIVFTFKSAIFIVKEQLLTLFIRSPFLPISILFTYLISQLDFRSWSKINKLYIPGYLLLWMSVYVALHLPFIYKAGIAYMPGRVLNVTQFFFIAGWLGFIVLLVRTYGEKQPGNKLLGVIALALSSMIILTQLIMPNKIQSALKDWLSGNASNYEAQLESRYELFSNSKGQDVVVAPIANIPYTIFIADITEDSLNARNDMVGSYYGLKSVKADSSLLNQ